MTFLQSVLLGALQGVAEFLPVSSSGHLVVARAFMGVKDVPPLFDVVLHVATLLVVIFVFRKTILRLLGVLGRFLARKGTPEDSPDLRLIGVVLLASVFTAVIGLAISALEMESHPRAVSALFLVTAGLLLLTRIFKGNRDYSRIGIREGVVTGIAQGLGVFPGISRSGITITAALATGMDRSRAGEFSFILSLPAVAGALLLELKDFGELSSAVPFTVLAAGFLTAVMVGLASLYLLLRLIRGGRLWLFSFYLIPLGLAGLFLIR